MTFDTPVRALRLGYITASGNAYVQTVGDYVGGTKRGYILKPEHRALLDGLRPDKTLTDVSETERELLTNLESNHLVAIFPESAALGDLHVIPVMRKNTVVEEDLGDGGYLLRSGDIRVVLSELAMRSAALVNGRHDLATIATTVRDDIDNDESDHAWAASTGRSTDQLAFSAVMEMATAFQEAGLLTLEPTDGENHDLR